MVNEERRSFLRWAIHGMGAVFAAVLGLPALAYLVDARNRPAPNREFRTAQGIKLNELEVGVPRQGVIRDIRRDAWTLHPNDIIGRVWAVKLPTNEIKVFTTICPHLGCSINLDPPPNTSFTCPCHGGKFHLDGSLDTSVPNNPAPRGMDTLEWRADPDDHDLLQVKYMDFRQGEHDKIPKT
jgi:Rieske Fe-S protein